MHLNLFISVIQSYSFLLDIGKAWLLVGGWREVSSPFLAHLVLLDLLEILEDLFRVLSARSADWYTHQRLRGLVRTLDCRHFGAQRMLHQCVLLFANRVDALIVFVVAHAGGECVAAGWWSYLAHFSGQVPDFASEARHEWISFGSVWLLFQAFGELLLGFLLALPQGVLEEGLGAPLLQGLLLEDVLEQVFISLD